MLRQPLRPVAGRHETSLVRDHDRLDPVADPELAKHSLDVCLDGRLADHELGRQFAVGQAAGHKGEHLEHRRFAVETGLEVYFCDPRSPWQRGSNENTNGLLRQYFPKGESLAAVSQQRLDEVARKLNGRPRETLDLATPAEKLAELIDGLEQAGAERRMRDVKGGAATG